jgi:hypothetical protein
MADIVEQVDREAAWQHRSEPYRYRLGRESATKTKHDWMDGVYDDLPHIKSYARHRQAERTRLVTLLRGMAGDMDAIQKAKEVLDYHMQTDAREDVIIPAVFLGMLDTLEGKLG